MERGQCRTIVDRSARPAGTDIELPLRIGGAAVGQAVSRFGRLREKSRELRRRLDQVEHQLSNVET